MSSQTLIQKILANAAGKEMVDEGEIVLASPYRILSHDNSAAISRIFQKMGAEKVWDNKKSSSLLTMLFLHQMKNSQITIKLFGNLYLPRK